MGLLGRDEASVRQTASTGMDGLGGIYLGWLSEESPEREAEGELLALREIGPAVGVDAQKFYVANTLNIDVDI